MKKEEWNVFICYRQVDGRDTAEWLYQLLDQRMLPFIPSTYDNPPKLNVYFDQAAPAVANWKEVHLPALQISKAMIVVCTPGIYSKLEPEDWVYMELEWLIKNRKSAPIIIEATPQEGRWVPQLLKHRWPDAQRITLQVNELNEMSEQDRKSFEERTFLRIVSGIRLSEEGIRFEQLEKEKAQAQRLKKTSRFLMVALAIAIVTALIATVSSIRATQQAKEIKESSILIQSRATNDPLEAALLLSELEKIPKHRQALNIIRSIADDYIPLEVIRGHQGQITSLSFSRNGSLILTASADGTARVNSLIRNGQSIILKGHKGPVTHATFDLTGSQILTTSSDRNALVWKGPNFSDFITLPHPAPVSYGSFDNSGKKVLTISEGMVTIWNIDKPNTPISVKDAESLISAATFNPQGNRVAIGLNNGKIRIVDPEGVGNSIDLIGHYTAKDEKHKSRFDTLSNSIGEEQDYMGLFSPQGITDLKFSSDGLQLVSTSYDGTARLWSITKPMTPKIFIGHGKSWVWGAAFSPDNKKVLTWADESTAYLWPTNNIDNPIPLRGHYGNIQCAAYSNNGLWIATGSSDATAKLWNISNGYSITLKGHSSTIKAITFSADDKLVATGSLDGTVRVWRTEHNEPIFLHGNKGFLKAAIFSPDGTKLLTIGDSIGRIWQVGVWNNKPTLLIGHTGSITDASFSPDGEKIVTASTDSTVRVWKVRDNSQSIVLRGHQEIVYTAKFDSDGSRIATTSRDGTARIWQRDGKGEPMILQGDRNEFTAAEFSQDGKTILTASYHGTADLWNLESKGKPLSLNVPPGFSGLAKFSPDKKKLLLQGDTSIWILPSNGQGQPKVIYTKNTMEAVFSPDSRTLLTVHVNGTARLWDLNSNNKPKIFIANEVTSKGCFSPDGNYIAIVGSLTAFVWPIDQSYDPMVLTGHQEDIQSVTFSPDGKYLVTTSGDETAGVYRVNWDDLRGILRSSTHDCLTIPQRMQLLSESYNEAEKAYKSCASKFMK
jgi:WD40 repeat protein